MTLIINVKLKGYPSIFVNGPIKSEKFSQLFKSHSNVFRFVKETTLWACLAGMALAAKQLNTAEIAYTNLQVTYVIVNK